jgi:hypothetical protein
MVHVVASIDAILQKCGELCRLGGEDREGQRGREMAAKEARVQGDLQVIL